MISTMILFAAAAAEPATGARQQALVIMPTHERQRAFQEQWGYADAVVSNGIVYVSGVPAFLAAGETDPAIGYHRAFKAIGKTLERAGASWDDVVEMTTYHTDPSAQIEAFVKVKSEYMKGAPPAWSAVGTSALLQPNGLVEISVIAHLPEKAAE